MSLLISHPLLGEFIRTGIFRAPREGEYYVGFKTRAVCLAVQDGNIITEILTPIVKPAEVALAKKIVKGRKS